MRFLAHMPITPIKLYTPNGSKLISKIRTAANTEIAKIETHFGKGLTTITTDFDKNGQPLKRIVEKREGKTKEKTVYTYEGIFSVRRRTKIDKFINNKYVQTTIKAEVLQNTNNQPFLTRRIFTTTPIKNKSRKETQIIEELSTHKHRKYIRTTAIRDKKGELSNKTIEGNIDKLKELTKQHYLYFRSYSLKDFLISIIPHAKNKQNVQNRNIDYIFGSLNEQVLANSTSVDGFGTIKFDMDKLLRQSAIVDTVNHEHRHQYQDSLIEKFKTKGFKGLLNKIFHPFQYNYSRKCAYAKNNYTSSTVDQKKYFRNFLEIDARRAADTAKQEFLAETMLLDEIFPHSKELFTGNDEFFKAVMRLCSKRTT